jgi:IclR family pca regulon transcriptional regulator
MIACFPPEVRKQAVETWPIVQATPKTTLDRSKIAAEVEQAAADRYAITEGQNIMNEIGIAAPILASDGQPVAAAQCSISSLRWSVERVRSEIAPRLIEVANSIHIPKRR